MKICIILYIICNYKISKMCWHKYHKYMIMFIFYKINTTTIVRKSINIILDKIYNKNYSNNLKKHSFSKLIYLIIDVIFIFHFKYSLYY